jgi:hypothetical protein
MQELDHETGEALEGSRYADGRADLDENAFGGVDVDLELAGFVDGGVEKSEETLSLVSRRGHRYGYHGIEARPGALCLDVLH